MSDQDISPRLDYGVVEKVWDRGFGFLNSWIFCREVFFHFSAIHDKRIKALIDYSLGWSYSVDNSPSFREEDVKNNPDLNFSPGTYDYYQLRLWFTFEKQAKGLGAVQIWPRIEKIPDDILSATIDIFIEAVSKRPGFETTLLSQLFRDGRISDARLMPLLYSEAFRRHPLNAVNILRTSQIELYKSAIDWLKIYTTSEELPEGIEQAAQKLLSPQEVETLHSQRKLYEAQWIKEKSIIYSREMCNHCGTYSVYSDGPNRTCTKCGATWYINHCWNCRHHRSIDSREPDVHQCNICGWYICASCGACSPNCKR